MDKIITFINQGWFGILIGAVLSIYVYRKSISVGFPAYQYKSTRLLRRDKPNVPDKVRILFDGKEVTRLTKTYIVFWNRGRKTIDRNDIVRKILLTVEDGEMIVDAKIVKHTREENNFQVNISGEFNNKANVSFDYLDFQDGAVVEILHTSNSLRPKLSGTIKGVPKGIRNYGVIQSKSRKSKKIIMVKELVPFIMLLLSMWILYFSLNDTFIKQNHLNIFLVSFTVCTFVVYTILNLTEKSRKFPKKLSYDEIA